MLDQSPGHLDFTSDGMLHMCSWRQMPPSASVSPHLETLGAGPSLGGAGMKGRPCTRCFQVGGN